MDLYNDWIPVREILPEDLIKKKTIKCLVSAVANNGRKNVFVATRTCVKQHPYLDRKYRWGRKMDQYRNITHWRLCPKPEGE